jgi:hypothetical protein
MAGDRVLKVEVTFNLANGKYLDLPSGIKIFSSLVPDPDDAPDQPNPPLFLPTVLEAAKERRL